MDIDLSNCSLFEYQLDHFKIKNINNIEDKKAWESIQLLSDKNLNNNIPQDFFDTVFNQSFSFIQDRVFFAQCKFTNNLIGTCSAWESNGVGRLHWLAVLPEYQRKGIGTTLIQECLNRFLKLQYKKVFLHTWSNKCDAIRLYKKFNFSTNQI